MPQEASLNRSGVLNEVGLNLLFLSSVSSVALIHETFVTPEIFVLSIKLLSFIVWMNFL
jgi:hypothetical protein